MSRSKHQANILSTLTYIGMILLFLGLFWNETPVSPVHAYTCGDTYTVNSTADSGTGTLRDALSKVCSGGTITFDPSLSPKTITVSWDLNFPKSVTVYGYLPGGEVTVNLNSWTMEIGSGETVNLKNITIKNGFRALGGAIENSGTLNIYNSTFADNIARVEGGAIESDSGSSLNIYNSTFSNNQAQDVGGNGGAILSRGTLSISNSTFYGNKAHDNGGAIYSVGTSVFISNGTFYGNQANRGGAIFNDTATLTYTNTILGGSKNWAKTNFVPDCYNAGGASVSTSSTHNLIEMDAASGNTCGNSGSNYTVASPKLLALASNGGPTDTIRPDASLPASPAIDAGDASTCTQKDQRSVPRPQGSKCDIGAVENGANYATPSVSGSTPSSGSSITTSPNSIDVVFNKDVDAATAQDTANYLLVRPGADGIFNTQTCKAGLAGDDVSIKINSVSYDSSNYTATLNITGPLANSDYRLLVCGTTSITDTVGMKLNDGADSTVSFTVGTSQTGGSGTMPGTGFAPAKFTFLPSQPPSLTYNDEDLTLKIPVLGISEPIVGVPQESGWNVAWLGQRIGYLQGTAFPSLPGNSVLAAHVYNADGLPGPFINLNQLKYGDSLVLHAFGQDYIYQVRSVQDWVPARDTRLMTKHETLPWLTLITCHGFNPKTASYYYRTLARAVLMSVKP